MSEQRPLPVLPAGSIEGDLFWSAAAARRLIYQVCDECKGVVFYPRRHCSVCGSGKLQIHQSAGVGTVYSFTTIRVHPEPYFAGRVPYVVGFVDLDEGFRLLSELRAEPGAVTIGDRVVLEWDTTQEPAVPTFRPESQSTAG